MSNSSSMLQDASVLSDEALAEVHGGRGYRGGRIRVNNQNFGIRGLTLDDFNTVINVNGSGNVVAGRDVTINDGGNA